MDVREQCRGVEMQPRQPHRAAAALAQRRTARAPRRSATSSRMVSWSSAQTSASDPSTAGSSARAAEPSMPPERAATDQRVASTAVTPRVWRQHPSRACGLRPSSVSGEERPGWVREINPCSTASDHGQTCRRQGVGAEILRHDHLERSGRDAQIGEARRIRGDDIVAFRRSTWPASAAVPAEARAGSPEGGRRRMAG